jgi:hypothetical protein
MAAGLGFKDFVTGEVLTAADVDGYLMQGVWVFASAAARDAAVTSPQEGNFAYLKDTNVTTYYTGSAWANLDTTGMTNPMTTTGDTIYSSSGSTPARLGIGTTGQVLTVASGIPSWATPASGSMTLLSTTTLSGVSTTVSSISGSYTNLYVVINNAHCNSATNLRIDPNSTNNISFQSGTFASTADADSALRTTVNMPTASNVNNSYVFQMYQYANAVYGKAWNFFGTAAQSGATSFNKGGCFASASAITALKFNCDNGTSTFSGGQVLIYGVN